MFGAGACTPLPSPPLREHAATHSRPRARPAMRPMPAHGGAAGLGRGALPSPHSLSLVARTLSLPLLAPARQHEPNPHPAPHHPRPSAQGSRALRHPRVRAGEGGIGADKGEMDLFSKTFDYDLEEREGGELCRRVGGADDGAVPGQVHSARIDAVGGGRGGREGGAACTFRCREPGREGPRAGSPTPHTSSSTPTPQSPAPHAVRAETRKWSPPWLPGDHVKLYARVV